MRDTTKTDAAARAARKTRTGVVVSDKMDMTVSVLLTRRLTHHKYGNQVTRSTKVKARIDHDAKAGDTVRIMETRPLAKTVRWRTVAVVERAK
jgi:small subunit ribosomal protein S17